MPEDGTLLAGFASPSLPQTRILGRDGHARLEIGVAPDGRSFLRRQDVRYPFHICRPFRYQGDPEGMATIYLQSCAGGIFDGDDLEQVVTLDRGANLHITSQASTIIHETPEHGAALTTTLKAEAGCCLDYLPDPVILFPRARLRSNLTAALDPTAIAILADSFIWHDPEDAGRCFDKLSSETAISINGLGLVALDRFTITGSDLLRRKIGVNGDYRAQGSMLVVTGGHDETSLLDSLQQALASEPKAYAMASSLPQKTGYWVRILAADAVVLRRLQQTVWRIARSTLTGRQPVSRRK